MFIWCATRWELITLEEHEKLCASQFRQICSSYSRPNGDSTFLLEQLVEPCTTVIWGNDVKEIARYVSRWNGEHKPRIYKYWKATEWERDGL